MLRRSLMAAMGCLGLVWGTFVLPRSEAVDDLQDMESRILRSETFSTTALKTLLEDHKSAQNLSACDSHSQRAMLLLELPLAETALYSGAADDFDRYLRSLETRSRLLLACAPRDSFTWLLMFNLERLHGRLTGQAFKLLAMSYETSPNEAWISTRRTAVAAPFAAIVPEQLRKNILIEFEQLVRSGYFGVAAHAYLASPESVRSLLLAKIERLAAPQQKGFFDALQKPRS